MKKNTVIVICIIVALAGSGFLLWKNSQKNISLTQQINEGEKINKKEIHDDSTTVFNEEEATQYIQNWNGDTSGWETYRNEEFGIEFRYPKQVLSVAETRSFLEGGLYEGYPIFNIALNPKGEIGTEGINIEFNSLVSLQDVYAERYGECKTVPLDGKRNGRVCKYAKAKEFQESFVRYDSLINQGVCLGSFLVNFNKVKRESGDTFDRIFVNCGVDQEIAKIYKEVYQSLRFLR